MKKHIWIFAFIVGACGEANDSSPIEGTQIPANAIVQDYASIAGLQRAIVKSGEITSSEGDFLNGLHHGTWTVYDNEGKVASITTYQNGKKQGVELIFDNQGYVQSKASYHDDQLDGEYLAYKRRKITDRKMYEAGQMNGLVQKFYVDGTLMQESTYVNGIIDGVAKWYDQEGNLTIEYTYNMGKLVEQ
jgi:antitoxin component YwqK of YwqJK toxin-antitoxin module